MNQSAKLWNPPTLYYIPHQKTDAITLSGFVVECVVRVNVCR